MRYYNKITSTVDLHRLDSEAKKENKKCVGVTKNGDLYTIDEGKSHRKISIDEAAIMLETTQDEIQKLLEARGDYQIKDPEPEVPAIETVPDNISQALPVEAEDIPEEPKEVISLLDIAKSISELKDKIEKLQESVNNLYL